MRRNIPQVDKLEQARQGSVNEDPFANNNQKCTRNVKRTMKTQVYVALRLCVKRGGNFKNKSVHSLYGFKVLECLQKLCHVSNTIFAETYFRPRLSFSHNLCPIFDISLATSDTHFNQTFRLIHSQTHYICTCFRRACFRDFILVFFAVSLRLG